MRTRVTTFAVAAVAVLTLVGAACANNTTTPPGATGSASASVGGTPIPSFGTLTAGELQVASCLNYAPFEVIKKGTPQGFDIDVTDAVAHRLGLTVKWIKTDFDTSFTALHGDKFDMIAAAVTATGKIGVQRAQIVDFSSFYFNSQQSLAVNTEKTPDIKSTDNLTAGMTVGVQKGTTGADWSKTNLAPKGIQIKYFQEAPDAFTDLQAGHIQGVINDAPSSVDIVKDHPGEAVVQYINTNEKYAFAFSPSNPALREAWNLGLAQVIKDGTYAQIFQKWFPGVQVPPEFRPGA